MNPSVPAPWTEYTFHQYTDKGPGPQYGTESLNVDMNQFNGTTADLLKFAGLEVEPEPEPPPTEDTMWSDNALGLFSQSYVYPAALADYDFLIAEIGESFTANVQSAYDAKIPCILFAPNKVLKWHVDFGLNNPNWPTAEQEPLIKDLDRYIMMGDVKREIHGIMLDCEYVTDEFKSPLTVNWWYERAKWMLDMIWNRYRLPIYLYMNKDPVTEYNVQPDIELVYKLCADYGVSVVDFVAEGFPSNSRQPWRPYVGPDYPWYFWLYAWTPGRFIYNGTVEELYAALEYEAYPPYEPPDPEPDDDPLLERVEDLELISNQMSDDIEELKLLEQRIQALENWKNKPL